MKLVECVPNVSEGRDQAAIDAMAAAVKAAGPVRILDIKPDVAHHRTVFTWVGAPEAVREAVFALYQEAVKRIDLRKHKGEHPRMGAVDVCPFVPLQDVTNADCVRLSEEVGGEIAKRFQIPVYLYSESARSPARRSLPDIRKGEFEGFPEKIKQLEWVPDFGPAVVHPSAGVTAVGCRPFLIAYNVNLRTSDVELAKRIAKELRESSGGLPKVQAKGMELGEGKVQVSMNLLDYRVTPPSKVTALVREKAAAAGVEVAESEVIGMMPADLLVQEFRTLVSATDFTTAQVIELGLLEK